MWKLVLGIVVLASVAVLIVMVDRDEGPAKSNAPARSIPLEPPARNPGNGLDPRDQHATAEVPSSGGAAASLPAAEASTSRSIPPAEYRNGEVDLTTLEKLGYPESLARHMSVVWKEMLEEKRKYGRHEATPPVDENGHVLPFIDPRQTDAYVREEELGEDAFDALLYATGTPNRVELARVMPGSLAEQAGLMVGDQILAYDGKRIHHWNEMVPLFVVSDDSAPTVPVQIQRGSENLVLMVERRPLGVGYQLGFGQPAPR